MVITEELAELIGAHIGDGCLSDNGRYKECALLGDMNEEEEYYDNHIMPLFNRLIAKPLIHQELKAKKYPSMGVYGFLCFDERIFNYYKSLGITVGSKINTKIPKTFLTKRFAKHTLRGIFDTDGCLYFDKNRTAKKPINKVPIIKLASTSKPLINQIYTILLKMGYNPKLKKPYKGKRDKNMNYPLIIYRKNDILNYIERDFGFNNPKHKTKWEFYKKYGYYIPRMTIKERRELLKQ